ncbi:MAG: N-6 DNA methylase [Candidatus Heimdallarchaeota archaeon]|nr:N-6 DNA methylase [Candidatus Heimdallarchaeota archaeon]
MLLAHLEVISQEAHIAREEKYLKIIRRYKNDEPVGQREVDLFSEALLFLMKGMKQTNNELLGVVYETLALNYKGFGQFFTPLSVSKLMTKIVLTHKEKENPSILDPCVGSGRLLVEAHKIKPNGFFVGQDISLTCVRMTALNFLFFNMNGLVIWGDSLALEAKLAYRTIKTPLGGAIYLIEKDSEFWPNVEQIVRLKTTGKVVVKQTAMDQFISQEGN